jgi:hypothetical protein
MRKPCLSAFLLVLSFAFLQTPPAEARWPTIERQMAQDFSRLHPGEARDVIALPPWLRVSWRKAHPETIYSAKDPAGCYPRVLEEVHPWMLGHRNLLSE